MSDYTIIENICPKDESVKFYNPKRVHFPIPQAETDKKRFSFVFKPVFNTSLLFLQCELTLCTKKGKDLQKLPKVGGPSSVCPDIWTFLGEVVTYRRNSITAHGGLGFLVGELPDWSDEVLVNRKLSLMESERINSDGMTFFPCMLLNCILQMINQDYFPLRERSGFIFAIQIVCRAKSTESLKDMFSVRINFSTSHWDLYCNWFLTFSVWVIRLTCLRRPSKGN